MIEVHHDPDHALSDGAQSLFPEQFATLVSRLREILPVVHRTLSPAPAQAGAPTKPMAERS
jgi:3-deoxy-7-phosphoheptulonate synthase